MFLNKKNKLLADENFRLNFLSSLIGHYNTSLIAYYNNEKAHLSLTNNLLLINADTGLIGIMTNTETAEKAELAQYFSINYIHRSFLRQAHYTSLSFPEGVSAFEKCNLTIESIPDFSAPFVEESKIKVGILFKELVTLDEKQLLIGEIICIEVDDRLLREDGHINFAYVNTVSSIGNNQYGLTTKPITLSEAKLDDLPNFKQKERPDNVVFDEATQSYNSSLLPYGTNIGAPSIIASGLSHWKNSSIKTFNYSLSNKIEGIKKEYQQLIDEFNVNKMLYEVNMNFEPIVGKIYHLYKNEQGEPFLSLIPPSNWDKEHLGAYQLNHEKIWQSITDASTPT